MQSHRPISLRPWQWQTAVTGLPTPSLLSETLKSVLTT
jgi:hypothetical protein